jgi:hypothetical protein
MIINGRIALFILAFFAFFAANAQIREKHARKIGWKPVQKIEAPGSGTQSFLFFEGAQYDPADNGLPSCFERIKLPPGYTNADITLVNTTYLPLPENEALLVKQDPGPDITPGVRIGYERKVPYALVSFVPLRKNPVTGKLEKLVSYNLSVVPAHDNRLAAPAPRTYAPASVLASGTWYKIGITQTGIYKISYAQLTEMGIAPGDINPRELRIFGNGGGMLPYANSVPRKDDLVENAIYVEGEGDNVFNEGDYVLFYGEGPTEWDFTSSDQRFHHKVNLYSDTTYYFIGIDGVPGKRIQTQRSLDGGIPVTSFDDYAYHQLDAVNVIKSGREWYGESFETSSSHTFSFNFPNLDTSTPGYVKVDLGHRSATQSQYTIQAGSTTSSILANGFVLCFTCDFLQPVSTNFPFTATGSSIPVTVTKVTASAAAWLNYIELNVRRSLIMTGSQMSFRDKMSVGPGNVAEFTLGNANASVQVWDVTDPANAGLQSVTLDGSALTFSASASTLREFIAFNGSFFYEPVPFGRVDNQNLHALGAADLIIVSHPLFLEQANRLAELHRDLDSMRVVVVTPQQVYNEFSSGAQDVSAIRDFVKMFYDRAAAPADEPKYLMLFGDGSFDNKNRYNPNSNFIPTYQSLNSHTPTTSYVSDDFFGLLDNMEGQWNPNDGDIVDVGVGRIPVRNLAEADAVVKKILKYTNAEAPPAPVSSCDMGTHETSYGDWRNTVCFIGDDEDGSLHLDQAESMAKKVDTLYPVLNIDKIYLDAYDQVSTTAGPRYPHAAEALDKRMEKGALIVNYTGHGGELGLTGESVVDMAAINKWRNINNLPLMVTATCEFSRFDDPERTSAGEHVLTNSEGGGIGLLSTVRLVYAAPNFFLNMNFYAHAFEPIDGEMPRLGDLFRLTKVSSGSAVNNRNFTLLGDPALRLAYPEYKVVTTEINNKPINIRPQDTINGLSVVTVKGYVADRNGIKLTGYSGTLYPTVYDKARTITTLSNDGSISPARNFRIQNSVIFKGRASVSSGNFSFSFIVPKDIIQQYGLGKISYYALANGEDANGYYKMMIGGMDSAATSDVTGPQVELYMNDSNFVFGDEIYESDPQLYAIVYDSTGINMMSLGLGHDIVAVLDERSANPIILNDHYEADLNNYKKGTIRYPFDELADGHHTLSLKIWDVHNNSSQAYTEFTVASSEKLALDHVLNYPNPFTTKTQFMFEYNQACDMLDVQVQVFTVSGKLVKTINTYVRGDGRKAEPVEWDGTDDFGDRIGKGVYIYHLKVRNSMGEMAERYERLVILR